MVKMTNHVGVISNTGTRCCVMFRQVPDEPDNCLIVETDSLPDALHQDMLRMIDSAPAQATGNLWEVAQRTTFSNGNNVLGFLHRRGLMKKMPTDAIDMKPTPNQSIKLSDLNAAIAEQVGDPNNAIPRQTVEGPAQVMDNEQPIPERRITTENVEQEIVNPMTVPQPQAGSDGVIDNAELAANMLAQAKSFKAEADSLMEQAYELDPSLKPTRGRPKKNKG